MQIGDAADGKVSDTAVQAVSRISFRAYRRTDDRTADNISISAVYRNLSALEEDGILKRSIRENTREVYYQYIAAKECREHLHLSCRVCGKSIHLDEADTAQLIQNTLRNTGFQIEKTETILYGICEGCRK